jgi:Rrf2 family transcriptional regulator, iron-sulfur cluster assembly transcription factor
MSIIFSRQCEYALQAVSFLALQPAGKLTSIRELTGKLHIPYHFLAKILQRLTAKKLLVSQKGPSGGFALALPADQITLFHIVDAIDGSGFTHKCVMGFPECSDKIPCAVHKHWAQMRDGIYAMLVSENITEMAKAMKKPEYRL